jgi:hypothetical protein
MMRALSLSRALAIVGACALALAAFGCARAAPRTGAALAATAPTQPPAGAHEGETVVAVVERLERAAHEEWLDGPPGVLVSDVVAFAIVRPAGLSTLLFAHVSGHPRAGGRPLLLGDAVTFVLPRDWQNRDLALADLADLAFVGGPD